MAAEVALVSSEDLLAGSIWSTRLGSLAYWLMDQDTVGNRRRVHLLRSASAHHHGVISEAYGGDQLCC